MIYKDIYKFDIKHIFIHKDLTINFNSKIKF